MSRNTATSALRTLIDIEVPGMMPKLDAIGRWYSDEVECTFSDSTGHVVRFFDGSALSLRHSENNGVEADVWSEVH